MHLAELILWAVRAEERWHGMRRGVVGIGGWGVSEVSCALNDSVFIAGQLEQAALKVPSNSDRSLALHAVG